MYLYTISSKNYEKTKEELGYNVCDDNWLKLWKAYNTNFSGSEE